MRVHIVGAGAVGMLLACQVRLAGHEAVLVTRTKEQAILIEQAQLTFVPLNGYSLKIAVKATNEYRIEQDDIVIVAVKYHHLHTVYEKLQPFKENTIIFIQNGLAHYEEALAQPYEQLIFGSAQFGASKLDETTVAHKGIGVLKLAIARGNISVSEQFQSLHSEQFPIELVDNAQQMLFEKALLNCFINPLTAILQVQNGQLLKNEAAYTLLQQLYEELMQAFPTMREKFPFQFVRQLCENTAQNTSSMLADKLAGRQTEIKTIVGAVLQQATIPIPTLQTLYAILLAEQIERERLLCN